MEACREKTLGEELATIYSIAKSSGDVDEIVGVVERALKKYEAEKQEICDTFYWQKRRMEAKMGEQELIISCLVEALQRERSTI